MEVGSVSELHDHLRGVDEAGAARLAQCYFNLYQEAKASGRGFEARQWYVRWRMCEDRITRLREGLPWVYRLPM